MLAVTVNREELVEDEEHPHNSSGNRKTDKKRCVVFMGGLFVYSDFIVLLSLPALPALTLLPAGHLGVAEGDPVLVGQVEKIHPNLILIELTRISFFLRESLGEQLLAVNRKMA
jgi:hypothetical protein